MLVQVPLITRPVQVPQVLYIAVDSVIKCSRVGLLKYRAFKLRKVYMQRIVQANIAARTIMLRIDHNYFTSSKL